MLINGTSIGTAIGWTLELAFELGTCLDQPSIPERNQEHRINLRIDYIVTACHKTESADVSGQNGNRLVGLSRLRHRRASENDHRQRRHRSAPDTLLQTNPHAFCRQVRHVKPHVSSWEDCRSAQEPGERHRGNIANKTANQIFVEPESHYSESLTSKAL